MTEHKVLVRINKGFGSHTIMSDFVDDAGEKIQRGILHRNTDTSPFELPISDYNLFSEKYSLCDPATGDIVIPTIPVIPQADATMADKIQAASKKSGRKQPAKV